MMCGQSASPVYDNEIAQVIPQTHQQSTKYDMKTIDMAPFIQNTLVSFQCTSRTRYSTDDHSDYVRLYSIWLKQGTAEETVPVLYNCSRESVICQRASVQLVDVLLASASCNLQAPIVMPTISILVTDHDIAGKVKQSAASISFHSYLLNRLTFKLQFLCVYVMTTSRLGLKVEVKGRSPACVSVVTRSVRLRSWTVFQVLLPSLTLSLLYAHHSVRLIRSRSRHHRQTLR